MNLYIHKLDCLIDGAKQHDTVHAEPYCLARAIQLVPACPIENIYIIGSHPTRIINKGKHATLIDINVHEFLSETYSSVLTKPTCQDMWILWGGNADLIQWTEPHVGKAIVNLCNMWAKTSAMKFALCTDMRFQFKEKFVTPHGTIYLKQDPSFGKVVELTQCMNLQHTIFDAHEFLPLFTMPFYNNAQFAQFIQIGQKKDDTMDIRETDLVFPTRDWNMLSHSKLAKFIDYHVHSKLSTAIPGIHKHVAYLFADMTSKQIETSKSCLRFDVPVTFEGLSGYMSHSIATIAIGDAEYEAHQLLPNRIGEGLKARIFVMIDEAIDPEHKLFSGGKIADTLANATYVKSYSDVLQRLKFFKANTDKYATYVYAQLQHIINEYQLGQWFMNKALPHAIRHLDTHNCDCCDRGLL